MFQILNLFDSSSSVSCQFFCPSPFDLFVLTSFIKKIAYARQVYILYLEIRTLLYRSRYLEEDEKKHMFEKVRKNLVVSKLKITRSSISPMGERGYVFESHRIFLPFVLDSLIEHEILVKFTFVIQYTQRKKPLYFREIQWGIYSTTSLKCNGFFITSLMIDFIRLYIVFLHFI